MKQRTEEAFFDYLDAAMHSLSLKEIQAMLIESSKQSIIDGFAESVWESYGRYGGCEGGREEIREFLKMVDCLEANYAPIMVNVFAYLEKEIAREAI